jgi:hypothetical protein
MGLMDKLKTGAEELKAGAGEAGTRARETVQEAQIRRDLQHAYMELGRTTFMLVDQGTLVDERLDHAVQRVRELGAQLPDPETAPEAGEGA